MRINTLLIDSELAGALQNIHYAKLMYKTNHRNRALKSLKDAECSLDFIHWHITKQKTETQESQS